LPKIDAPYTKKKGKSGFTSNLGNHQGASIVQIWPLMQFELPCLGAAKERQSTGASLRPRLVDCRPVLFVERGEGTFFALPRTWKKKNLAALLHG